MSGTSRKSRSFRSSFPSYEDTGFRTGAWESGKAVVPEDVQPYHATMLHAFAEAARLSPKVGITLLPERERRPEEQRSYRELYHDACKVAMGLLDVGVGEGDRVLLVLPTSFDFVVSFFAAQMIKAIPVPAYPPSGLRIESGLRRMAHIARHSGAVACVTWEQVLPIVGDLGLSAPSVRTVSTVKQLANVGRLEGKLNCRPSMLAFLQYTSGSTGNPKGVALTHDNIVCNIHTIGQALEISRNDVVVSWCPLYHDMGLIGALLFAIYWRVPLVLIPPQAFLARPHRWLDAITRHRGTLSPAPNFGYALAVKRVAERQRKGFDLSSWRVALNGAEPVNLRTVQQFIEAYGPYGFRAESMLPVYGLAEASLAAAFPQPGTPIVHRSVDRAALANGVAVPSSSDSALTLVSVGQAVPGQGLLIVDERNRPLPEHEVGHIIVSGRSVMQGYYRDEDATAGVIQSGWLWTGDLGFVADGNLYITGRAKDLIILNGRNYYAEDLEVVAEKVEGVRAGGAVAFAVYDDHDARDMVVVVCETRVADAQERLALAQRVSEAIAEDVGVTVDEVVLTAPGAIPKTSSGKRQRSLCRARYLRDEIEPPRQSKVDLSKVFVRSGAGFLLMQARKLISRQREPE